MRKLKSQILPWLVLFPIAVYAYDVDEGHRYITEAAIDAARGTIESRLRDIDLSSVDNVVLGPYSDLTRALAPIRFWITYGAKQEDTYPSLLNVCNHFYDPIHEQPLNDPLVNAFCTPVGRRTSPEWSLEDSANIIGQDFSFWDAVRYYEGALVAPNKSDRDFFLGVTFRALGHTIHHLQDMAQPQHARNDAHPPSGRTLYEAYTKKYLNQLGSLPALAQYPLAYPRLGGFDKARSFWKDGFGRGIAEFSNRNFVTQGTNFLFQIANPPQIVKFPGFPDGPDVSTPPPICADPSLKGLNVSCEYVDIADIDPSGPLQNFHAMISFVRTQVIDVLGQSSADNARASTFSMFSDFGDNSPTFTTQFTFTVNRFTFENGYQFLLNRAVAYSAGLLNYFFRGSMTATVANGQINITNTSTLPMLGIFEVFYDNQNGLRGPVPNSRFVHGLFPNNNVSWSLSTPSDVALNTPFVVVFTGLIGTEDGVVGTSVSTKPRLTVTISPSGSGTVSSDPQGIACGPTCNAEFDHGTQVVLTATGSQGFAFDRWSGDCTGTNSTFTITIAQDMNCKAEFKFPLTITRTGTGTGGVASVPQGIQCAPSCNAFFDKDTQVTLTATAAQGSVFNSWGGDCSGNASPITITITRNMTCIAQFDAGASVKLNPFGNQLASSTYSVEVVDGALMLVPAAQDITVTLLREVTSQCRGLIFSSDRTVTVSQGQSSTTYNFDAARDPFCTTLPITTRYTITRAVAAPNTVLDLSIVPAQQRVLTVTR